MGLLDGISQESKFKMSVGQVPTSNNFLMKQVTAHNGGYGSISLGMRPTFDYINLNVDGRRGTASVRLSSADAKTLGDMLANMARTRTNVYEPFRQSVYNRITKTRAWAHLILNPDDQYEFYVKKSSDDKYGVYLHAGEESSLIEEYDLSENADYLIHYIRTVNAVSGK